MEKPDKSLKSFTAGAAPSPLRKTLPDVRLENWLRSHASWPSSYLPACGFRDAWYRSA